MTDTNKCKEHNFDGGNGIIKRVCQKCGFDVWNLPAYTSGEMK